MWEKEIQFQQLGQNKTAWSIWNLGQIFGNILLIISTPIYFLHDLGIPIYFLFFLIIHHAE